MTTIFSPVLLMRFDDTGKLLHFGCSDADNRLDNAVPFVTLDTGLERLHPVSLSDSEGYLCFTFADGSLFYLLPASSDAGIAFDTAGFFPAISLTDALCDDLSGLRILFGLPEGIPGAVGAEVTSGCAECCTAALPEDGFMGKKLAFTIADGSDTDSVSRLILFFA